jgi:hypothetical protein
MTSNANNSSRRAFFLRGGVTLGAGLATSAGATALLPAAQPALDAAGAADREAIRQLHREFIARVEAQSHDAAAATHRAYRSNARQQQDALAVAADGRQANATWHVDVQVATPLQGDSTAAQMARLQGQVGDLHWEAGRLEVQYLKQAGQWRMASLGYAAT